MRDAIPRRQFVKGVAALSALGMLGASTLRGASGSLALPEPTAAKLPRWRGFNLLEKFITSQSNVAFREQDFAWMAEWGFNFARLPMSYRCWSTPENWKEIDEKVMKEIDEAVAFGRRYGVHISINFHRAPGYSVDGSLTEPFNLWTDAEAQDAACFHWAYFAERYKDVPNSALSFDLVNEPATKTTDPMVYLDDASYAKVARLLVQAIRAKSPERLIISDGLLWGNVPVYQLADLGIAQSTRGYYPSEVSHWKAGWVGGSDQWPEPTWPLKQTKAQIEGQLEYAAGMKKSFPDNFMFQELDLSVPPPAIVDKEAMRVRQVGPWKKLEAMGVGVHVGEFGAFHHTPHAVTLAWMRDYLDLWREAGWGWALWNFRGEFGVLDSNRKDVKYESFRGHQLDREMLELLRAG